MHRMIPAVQRRLVQPVAHSVQALHGLPGLDPLQLSTQQRVRLQQFQSGIRVSGGWLRLLRR